jgi:hypothetical protein
MIPVFKVFKSLLILLLISLILRKPLSLIKNLFLPNNSGISNILCGNFPDPLPPPKNSQTLKTCLKIRLQTAAMLVLLQNIFVEEWTF